MAKKRKTRQQKIIAQLRRQLAQQQLKKETLNLKISSRQEAISYRPNSQPPHNSHLEKANNPVFSYDPNLIKKDILKTIFLSLGIIGLQFMLYLKLR